MVGAISCSLGLRVDEGNTLSRNLFIFVQDNNKEISHNTACASLLRHFASVTTHTTDLIAISPYA